MGFIEGELFRNVWLLVVSLIISQALMSLADEPIRCSRSVLDIEQTRPIKLSIQIYKADRLPIGESYVSGKQVVNSHAEHVANLDFSYHLKSGFKLYDQKVKAAFSSKLVGGGKLLDFEMSLVLSAFKNIRVRSNFTTEFQQELLQECSCSTEEGIVYVIVINSEKLDWRRKDRVMREERLARYQRSYALG